MTAVFFAAEPDFFAVADDFADDFVPDFAVAPADFAAELLLVAADFAPGAFAAFVVAAVLVVDAAFVAFFNAMRNLSLTPSPRDSLHQSLDASEAASAESAACLVVL